MKNVFYLCHCGSGTEQEHEQIKEQAEKEQRTETNYIYLIINAYLRSLKNGN